jgi:hypothetical protein
LPRSSFRPPNRAKYRAKSGLFTSAMLIYLSRVTSPGALHLARWGKTRL